MYCNKCGNKLNENSKFCPQCGQKVLKKTNIVNQNKIVNTQANDQATILCLVSIACYIVGPLILYINELLDIDFFNAVAAIITLAPLPIAIYTRIKYPNSQFAKVLLWVYIAITIMFIIYIVIMFIACMAVLESCDGIDMIAPILGM